MAISVNMPDASQLKSNGLNGFHKAAGELDASALKLTLDPNPFPPPPSEGLVFGTVFAPHMLAVTWSKVAGWGVPEIKPFAPVSLSPASAALQYGSALFEGMKAYKCAEGTLRLFRPDMNMRRMNRSAARIGLPAFAPSELLSLIVELVKINAGYVPGEPGHSLYIRPTLVGTAQTLGQGPPTEALLYVIMSPVGPYYPTGFKPVALLATSNYVRAWPGGVGQYKLGANYGSSVVPTQRAWELGYSQNLWLFGPDLELTEVGTMNLFLVFRRDDGSVELTTAPLDDGTVLAGVTRDSILTLARAHASGALNIAGLPPARNLIITERKVVMKELTDALESGHLLEIFGSGTAAIVCAVDRIGFEGKDMAIPVESDGFGAFSRSMLREIQGRQVGAVAHEGWSHVC